MSTSISLNSDHPDNQTLYTSSKEFLDLLPEVKIQDLKNQISELESRLYAQKIILNYGRN